jgi:hypothetical protein
VSTTVNGDLLAEARRLRPRSNDATLLDEALNSLVATHRSGEIDSSYAAYDEFPVDSSDEWGSLAAFRSAAAAS